MSSFDGQDLFGSGPHRFFDPGAVSRIARHEAPGIDGARVTWLGQGPKRIELHGRLVANDWTALRTLINAIKAVMDGRSAVLVDDLGDSHSSMLLTRFESRTGVHSGRQVSLGYEAEFVEAG